MRRMVLVAGLLMLFWPVAPAAAQDHYPSPAGTWTVNVDFNFIPDPAHPENTIPFKLANLQDFTSDGRTTNLWSSQDSVDILVLASGPPEGQADVHQAKYGARPHDV